ncbi:hypothetical protein H2248_001416 [Termitomyces sp. 'cryptogamus']|nr:hypothetical protein H2248_001416 [Termitomyces sp. 'cryptogamus']
MAIINFANPAACKWYQAKLEALINLGIDCFKCTMMVVPNESWFGVLDGNLHKGPVFMTETHDFFSLPLLLRPGAVIVLHDDVPRGSEGYRHVVYDYSKEVTILVNLASSATVDLLVEVPDSNNLGSFVAFLTIQGDKMTGSMKAVAGALKGQ